MFVSQKYSYQMFVKLNSSPMNTTQSVFKINLKHQVQFLLKFQLFTNCTTIINHTTRFRQYKGMAPWLQNSVCNSSCFGFTFYLLFSKICSLICSFYTFLVKYFQHKFQPLYKHKLYWSSSTELTMKPF